MLRPSTLLLCARRGGRNHLTAITTTRSARPTSRAEPAVDRERDANSSPTDSISSNTSSSKAEDRIRRFAGASSSPSVAVAALVAAVALLLLAAPPPPAAVAAPFPSLFGGGGNGGGGGSTKQQPLQQQQQQQPQNGNVVRALQQRQKRERLFGRADADPRAALASRLSAARDEAARIPLLVRIGQADDARLLLRERSLANLRRDLAYLAQSYADVVPEREARGVVEAVERLDGALRRAGARARGGAGGVEDGVEAAARMVKDLVGELDGRLERVARAVEALEAEAR
jgi:hypothetical protein